MSHTTFCPFVRIILVVLLAAAPESTRAATESIPLKPGWNSVWLTVNPADPAPAAVFKGLPIQQVWCWFPTERPVEFIENAESANFNVDGWRSYIPGDQPNAFLSNLGAIQAHRPYLIKVRGTANATLTVNGVASFKPLKWRADSFNLVGFHVDPVFGGGAAGAFFLSAPAHDKQSMHRLEASGEWTPMNAGTPIRANEAYWIYAKGMSQFNGPVSVQVDDGSFDFGAVDEEKQITITNNSSFPNTITLEAGGFPLVVAAEAGGVTTWGPATTLTRNVAAGAKTILRLGVQRTGVEGALQGTVTVRAPGVLLPFTATVSNGTAPPAAPLAGFGAAALAAAPAAADGGLWIGLVTLNKVSNVNGADGVPVETPAELSMRCIVHVDATGSAKLLKQVILMRKMVPPGQPTSFVLVTDDARISDFTGAVLKDGQSFAYRVSAIGYDFAGGELALNGNFGGTLSGQVPVGRSLPTNPTRHKFHPDHDDLDAQYLPLPNPRPANATPDQDEVWDITRGLQLTFDSPPSGSDPGNATLRTGTYRETIAGLHKQPIVVEGIFTLRRVNQLTELNPTP
jgi:hypothetical protein